MEKFTVYRSDNGDELWISQDGNQDLRKKKDYVPELTLEHKTFNNLFGRKDAYLKEVNIELTTNYCVKSLSVTYESTKLPVRFNDQYLITAP